MGARQLTSILRWAGPALLVLVVCLPVAEARFDAYATSTGARATAAYPDMVNLGDEFFLTVNADPGTGQINSFPTAPSGWAFLGCAFLGVDQQQTGQLKGQTVRLNMTGDTCSVSVKIVWASITGAQNGVTFVAASLTTDDYATTGNLTGTMDQRLSGGLTGDVRIREWLEPVVSLAWAAYAVLLYRMRDHYLRIAAAVVGWGFTLVPLDPLVWALMLGGQVGVSLIVLGHFFTGKELK